MSQVVTPVLVKENTTAKRCLWTAGWLVGHFVAVVVVLFSLLKVVPIFEKVFADFNTRLPELTQVAIQFSRWAGFYWWLITPIGLLMDAGMLFGLRCLPPGGRWLSSLWAAFFLVAVVLLLGSILLAVGLPFMELHR